MSICGSRNCRCMRRCLHVPASFHDTHRHGPSASVLVELCNLHDIRNSSKSTTVYLIKLIPIFLRQWPTMADNGERLIWTVYLFEISNKTRKDAAFLKPASFSHSFYVPHKNISPNDDLTSHSLPDVSAHTMTTYSWTRIDIGEEYKPGSISIFQDVFFCCCCPSNTTRYWNKRDSLGIFQIAAKWSERGEANGSLTMDKSCSSSFSAWRKAQAHPVFLKFYVQSCVMETDKNLKLL